MPSQGIVKISCSTISATTRFCLAAFAYLFIEYDIYYGQALMLVMNKKIATFMKQSNDGFKKDVYYRLLKNQSYNWRKLLSLSSVKLILFLKKLQNPKSVKVFIIDDTVEDKTGKKIEGSRDKLYSNKEKRFVRGINVISLNYSDGLSNFMLVPQAFPHSVHGTINRYLTRHPKLDIAIDLQKIMRNLTTTTEEKFIKRASYTHPKVVSAYRCIRRNIPYLFTYKKYPDLDLPFGCKIDNTTNAIDGGVFSPMKKLMNIHTGFTKSLKLKLVYFYLVYYHK